MVQPRHRSRPTLRFTIPWRGTAAAAAAAVSNAPMRDRQLYVFTSDEVTIEASQALRAAICPVCGVMIAGQPARLVQMAQTRLATDGRGDLIARAFLAHAYHWPLTTDDLNAAAHRITCHYCSNGMHP